MNRTFILNCAVLLLCLRSLNKLFHVAGVYLTPATQTLALVRAVKTLLKEELNPEVLDDCGQAGNLWAGLGPAPRTPPSSTLLHPPPPPPYSLLLPHSSTLLLLPSPPPSSLPPLPSPSSIILLRPPPPSPLLLSTDYGVVRALVYWELLEEH